MVYFKQTIIAIAGTLMLTACGETAFQDAFDAGKYSPDETKVQSNQALTTPPDLQLRPPSGVAPQQPAGAAPQPLQTAPPQYGTAPQQPQYGAPAQPQYGAPAQPRQAYIPPAGQQPPAIGNQPVDAFTKNGISHYKADGTKKTRQELLDELSAKKRAETKRKNPNHGTIFNLPQWFKDNQT